MKLFFLIVNSWQLGRRQVSGYKQVEHVEAVETGCESYVSQQTGSPAVSCEYKFNLSSKLTLDNTKTIKDKSGKCIKIK